MIDENDKKSILDSIATSGSVSNTARLDGNLNHVLSLSSGLPRIQTNVLKKFNLILSTPAILKGVPSFNIRCCVCKRMISYPAWYYEVKYAINHFHYFVCFDSESPLKPNCSCYRRV